MVGLYNEREVKCKRVLKRGGRVLEEERRRWRKYSGVGNDRKRVREEIGGTSRATRAETTLGDERETRVEEGERERERLEWQSRKANLTFISGILGFTPRRGEPFRIYR